MFHFIRLTNTDGTPFLVNPGHIISAKATNRAGSEHSLLTYSPNNVGYAQESLETVEQLIRKAAFLPEEMFSDQVDMDHYKMIIPPVDVKPVAEMTQEQLDELSDEFIGQGDKFSNIQTLFSMMVSEDCTLRDIARFIEKVKNWGYSLDTAV